MSEEPAPPKNGSAQPKDESAPPQDGAATEKAKPATRKPAQKAAQKKAAGQPKGVPAPRKKAAPAARKATTPRKTSAPPPERPKLLQEPQPPVPHDLDELPRERPEQPVAALPPWMSAAPLLDLGRIADVDLPAEVEAQVVAEMEAQATAEAQATEAQATEPKPKPAIAASRPRRSHRRPATRPGPSRRLIAVVLLVPLVLGAGWWLLRTPSSPGRIAAPAALTEWVAASVATTTPLLIPGELVEELATAGHQRDRLVGYGENPVEWRCCPILVLSSGIRTASPSITAAIAQSRLIAEVTDSGDRWQIREIFLGEPATEQERVKVDQVARVEAGKTLAANPRLDLAPGARATLAGGFVDARLMIALVGITARHNVTVGAFPVPRGEESTGAPRRTARITAIDGRPATAGEPAVHDVLAFLSSQVPPYRPDRTPISSDGGDSSLSITFHAPSPLGLIAPIP